MEPRRRVKSPQEVSQVPPSSRNGLNRLLEGRIEKEEGEAGDLPALPYPWREGETDSLDGISRAVVGKQLILNPGVNSFHAHECMLQNVNYIVKGLRLE